MNIKIKLSRLHGSASKVSVVSVDLFWDNLSILKLEGVAHSGVPNYRGKTVAQCVAPALNHGAHYLKSFFVQDQTGPQILLQDETIINT